MWYANVSYCLLLKLSFKKCQLNAFWSDMISLHLTKLFGVECTQEKCIVSYLLQGTEYSILIPYHPNMTTHYNSVTCLGTKYLTTPFDHEIQVHLVLLVTILSVSKKGLILIKQLKFQINVDIMSCQKNSTNNKYLHADMVQIFRTVTRGHSCMLSPDFCSWSCRLKLVGSTLIKVHSKKI